MPIMSVECKNCHQRPLVLTALLFAILLTFMACLGTLAFWVGKEQGRTERLITDSERAFEIERKIKSEIKLKTR